MACHHLTNLSLKGIDFNFKYLYHGEYCVLEGMARRFQGLKFLCENVFSSACHILAAYEILNKNRQKGIFPTN